MSDLVQIQGISKPKIRPKLRIVKWACWWAVYVPKGRVRYPDDLYIYDTWAEAVAQCLVLITRVSK